LIEYGMYLRGESTVPYCRTATASAVAEGASRNVTRHLGEEKAIEGGNHSLYGILSKEINQLQPPFVVHIWDTFGKSGPQIHPPKPVVVTQVRGAT